MIIPTIGRIVLFNDGSTQRVPAMICCVHSDTCINIGGFTQNGAPFSCTSIILCQDDDECHVNCAEWMPYQKQRAAEKVETSEPETETA